MRKFGRDQGAQNTALSAKFYSCRCCFLNLRGLNLEITFSFCFGSNFSLPSGKFKKSLCFIKYGYETKFDPKFVRSELVALGGLR